MNFGRLLFLVIMIGGTALLARAIYNAGLGAALTFLGAALAFHAWWYWKHGEFFD